MKRTALAVTLIMIILLTLIGCSNRASSDGVSYNLYFLNEKKNNLIVEERTIDGDNLEEIAENVVEALLSGPSVSSNYAVFGKETRLLGVDIKDGIANVKFNKVYFPEGENSNAKELLQRYSLVSTLCDINGIDKVKIFVDGVELINSLGVPVGPLGKEDILLNSTFSQNSNEENVTLYFPDKNARHLVKQNRKVPLIDNSIEKTILHELIKGPDGDELISTIPSSSKVLSVETKDGICFVNMSSDFVNNHSEGSTAENFTIYSIVNSLTELEGVNSVQFLIEGKKNSVLKHIVLDTPFTRDETYILD